MKGLTKYLTKTILLAVLVSTGAVQAGNYDSPAAANDPITDITQFYAFMNPACRTSGGGGCDAPPEELIVAFTVAPSANETTRFSDKVVYHIYFENDVGTDTQIDCSVSADQMITCAGLNGLTVTAPVGETGVNGDIRVFAGLRDDPRFADEEALSRFAQIGVLAFNQPGIDTIAGSNTLAIVVGIKNNSFPAGSGAVDSNGHAINVQKTWVSSERIEAAINAGVSGSWYNADQSGQGWVIEVLKTNSGINSLLFYFYGYENNGDRLWFIGLTDDAYGSEFTVDVLRTNGMGFGGDFDPGSLSNESVGSMTFTFTDCNTGNVDFTPSGGDLSAFSIPVTRLSNIALAECTYTSAGQVDRRGRPMTSTILPEEKRDAYNAASDPSTWDSMFRADLEAALTGIDSADGIGGNSFNLPSEIAPILADDRLSVDLAWSQCLGVWGFELSQLVPQPHTKDCGGRMLDYDYMEEFLSMTISGFDPLYDDFVTENDVPFLAEFPFMAAPH